MLILQGTTLQYTTGLRFSRINIQRSRRIQYTNDCGCNVLFWVLVYCWISRFETFFHCFATILFQCDGKLGNDNIQVLASNIRKRSELWL